MLTNTSSSGQQDLTGLISPTQPVAGLRHGPNKHTGFLGRGMLASTPVYEVSQSAESRTRQLLKACMSRSRYLHLQYFQHET